VEFGHERIRSILSSGLQNTPVCFTYKDLLNCGGLGGKGSLRGLSMSRTGEVKLVGLSTWIPRPGEVGYDTGLENAL